MNDRIYKLSYDIKPGDITKEQAESLGVGACDGVIIHSILYPKDGSRSECIASRGPDGEPLDHGELFKSWVTMASILSESKTLGYGRKQLCTTVFEHVRNAIRKGRGIR